MAVNKVVNKSTKSHGALKNVLKYVLQDPKVKDGYVDIRGPFPAETINWKNVYDAFIDEKNLWHKDSGRMYAHNIISFHKDENITPEECLEIGKIFVEKFFSNNQNLVTVHQDKGHLHIHIVTNTVSFIDGRKLHQSKKDLEKQKEFTNHVCQVRGLSVNEKGKHFDGSEIEEGQVTAWSKDKYNLLRTDKKSYLVDCAIAIVESKEKCTSKEAFIKKMSEKGWTVNWTDARKHITFVNGNGNTVRDSNISKTFSMNIGKEELQNEFTRQNDNGDREQLERYYREVEAVAAGSARTTINNHPNIADEIGEIGEEDAEMFIRELEAKERAAAKERKDRNALRQRSIAERERERERGAEKAEPGVDGNDIER